ncbi:hypothetical protein [Nocardia xishanensis]
MRARVEHALRQSSSARKSPRMCDFGLEAMFAQQRIHARFTARDKFEASAVHAFCRIDPGLVDRDHARILVRLHSACDETRCRPKLRGLQALAPVHYQCPPPQCGVPDHDIAVVVADYRAACSVLQAVKKALNERRPETAQAMAVATADFAAARWRRDALFLRALPGDGTVPTVVITKLRIDLHDIYRLVPALSQTKPPPAP